MIISTVDPAIETPLCYLSQEPMALPTLVRCEKIQRYCDYGTLALWIAQRKGCPNCFGQEHRFNLMHLQPDDVLIPKIREAVGRTFPNKSYEEYKFEKFLEQFSILFREKKQTYATKRVLRQLYKALCSEVLLQPEVFLSSPHKWDVLRYCLSENDEDQILTLLDHLIEEINEEDFTTLVKIILDFSKQSAMYLLSTLSRYRTKVFSFGKIWSWVISTFIEQQNYQAARKILNRFTSFYQTSASIDESELQHFQLQLDAQQKKEERELLLQFAELSKNHKGEAFKFWKKHNLHRLFELHRKGQLEEYFEGTKKS